PRARARGRGPRRGAAPRRGRGTGSRRCRATGRRGERMTEITAKDVKALRDRTGAGILACREALTEADGAIERAVEILRARGQAQAAKRAGAEASEGVVQTYVPAGNKI